MYQKYIKRVLDFIVALILIVLLLPIIIITAIMLRISLDEFSLTEASPREGLNHKPFKMYKLRTKISRTRGLPKEFRYTRLSRLIDILRINELPQLINILKGDMSFVGPRPFLTIDDFDRLAVSEKRYLVRPGISGLAQVKGARDITQKEKLEYDIIYYDNLSFMLDLKIFFLTPIAVLKELYNYLMKKRTQ